MHGAEIDTAASAENFTANRPVDFIRIAFGVRFGKRNADLHRAAGTYRIQTAKQFLPHGHHIDKVIKNRAELFLAAHLI